MNEEKLQDRCEILKKIILEITELYNDKNTNDDQKKLIETMIGASLWYLPTGKELWSGMMSREAYELYHKDTQKQVKLTKEHEYPRKIAAENLLTKELSYIEVSKDGLHDLYMKKYGKWNYVTPQENTKLRKFQSKKEFVSPEDSYRRAKIELIKVDRETFEKI